MSFSLRSLRILLIAVCLSAAVTSASAGQLVVSGCSVSNSGYLNALAKEYERKTGTHIFVRGGGSILGISELRGEKIDFAASCKSKDASDPADFEFLPVAWDALVFIVHKSNPLGNITPDEVRRIYEGTLDNWRQLGGSDAVIQSFVTRPQDMGGIGEALSTYILGGKPITLQPNSIVMASSSAVREQMVETSIVGFASSGFASARKRNVKMLSVNGVAPTKENIISGKYPFRRRLYLVYSRATNNPEVKRFIDYALSNEGQKFISSQGIPSLLEVK